MTDLDSLVDIERPDFYTTENAALYGRLRAEAPVHRYEPGNSWVLSKYDDIKYAERTPDLFRVGDGVLLIDARLRTNVEKGFFAEGAELVSNLDPPRHTEVRRTIAPAFTARRVALLEEQVRKTVVRILDGIAGGEPIEFVDTLARIIPAQAIVTLLGIPPGSVNVDTIAYWADEMAKVGDSTLSLEELAVAERSLHEMRAFLLDLFERKRREPGDDLMTTMVDAELDKAELTKANISMLAELVLTAGIHTTRNTLSGTVWSLARHPYQLALLAADPGLVPQTVEEVLRWFTPVPGFMRRATRDTEIRGTAIEGGDYVFLFYSAGNRDEEKWKDPDRFDITRVPEPANLAFGFGQHVCIGAALARMEIRVFLEEWLARFDGIELADGAVRVPSPVQHGWTTLPLQFRARRTALG